MQTSQNRPKMPRHRANRQAPYYFASAFFVFTLIGLAHAQSDAPPVTAPKIGDVSGCPDDSCVEVDVTIGETKRLFPDVHVLSDAEMPPPDLRGENFFSTINQALERVEDDGIVLIHTGTYAEELTLKRPRNITIAAYGSDQVTLTPPGQCLLYQPWFQEDIPAPQITLKGLVFRPQHLQEGEACIEVASNEFILEGVSIFLPPSNRAEAIRVQQGVVLLTNSALIGHNEASNSAGLVVAPTSVALLRGSYVGGFSIGIESAGGLRVADYSRVGANGTGILIGTQGIRNPDAYAIEIRDSSIQTENMSLARGSTPTADDSSAGLAHYGVHFVGSFSSTALLENIEFEGSGRQSGGVVVSGGALGKILVKSSSFDGLSHAVSIHGSITLENNVFGERPMYGRNSNRIAINLESRYYDTTYEIKNNTFLYNDYSLKLSPDLAGALFVSDNTGDIQKRGKQKFNLVRSELPKEADLMACEIDETSAIEKELMNRDNLGRIEACKLYQEQR